MDTAAGHAPHRHGASMCTLFASLLGRFAEIVGDGAAYATFHFAALQEGLAWARASAHPDRSVDAMLDAAHLHLKLSGSHAQRGDTWHIAATGPMLEADSPVLDGVVLGFYEGVLRGATGAAHEGRVERDGGVSLEIKRKVN